MDMRIRELARIRHELRERLMQGNVEGVWDLLAALRRLAHGEADLVTEHARWQLRFELLAFPARPAAA
jgi:hypothetical protein